MQTSNCKCHQWRGIETAPKDGTTVVLSGKLGAGLACWSDHNRGGWVSYYPFANDATHWMPLPQPPQSESK